MITRQTAFADLETALRDMASAHPLRAMASAERLAAACRAVGVAHIEDRRRPVLGEAAAVRMEMEVAEALAHGYALAAVALAGRDAALTRILVSVSREIHAARVNYGDLLAEEICAGLEAVGSDGRAVEDTGVWWRPKKSGIGAGADPIVGAAERRKGDAMDECRECPCEAAGDGGEAYRRQVTENISRIIREMNMRVLEVRPVGDQVEKGAGD